MFFFICLCHMGNNKVDDKRTVGSEAFARIAPACPVIADITTVHNLFDVLTCSSGPRLHFLIYDKYLRGLDKYASLLLANFDMKLVRFFSLIIGKKNILELWCEHVPP